MNLLLRLALLCLFGLAIAPSSAWGQGVFTALGRLSVAGTSLNEPSIPVAHRVLQARALGHLGDPEPAVAILTKTLARRPPEPLRSAVILSLAERRSTQAVPELLRVFTGRMGNTALLGRALSAIGGPAVIDAMREIVIRNDRVLRETALRTLARLAPEEAAPLLLRAWAAADLTYRHTALQIAIDYPNRAWLALLVSALREASLTNEHGRIVWALSRVSAGAGLAPLVTFVSETSASSWPVLVALAVCLRAYPDVENTALRERGVGLLDRADSAKRQLMLRTLAAGDDGEDTRLDAAALSDRQRLNLAITRRRTLRGQRGHGAEARSEAALALARNADPKVSVPLIAALSDVDSTMRRAAIVALARLDQETARAALLRHAAIEADPEIEQLAALSLVRDPLALDDPWGRGRVLLSLDKVEATEPVTQSPVDREVAPLAR